jgi:NAD(FAD)-utilizing enzyme possibly involved in translation
MIPSLEHAEFLRLGSIHRNTYVLAPEVLTPTLELRNKPGAYLAGQISGVEGYLESAATGLWLGLHLAGKIDLPPQETAWARCSATCAPRPSISSPPMSTSDSCPP